MGNLQIIDCTLRDGGYYNTWDFDRSLVEEYLSAMKESKVDYVEIGLRSLDNQRFYGPYFFSTDHFLKTLDIPSQLKIGVMINAKDFIKDNIFQDSLIFQNFSEKINSPVSLVRIASHIHEIPHVKNMAKTLRNLGYKVGLNVMQISNVADEVQDEVFQSISEMEDIDVLYFADSMGNLNSKVVIEIINRIRKVWKKPIGIHAHNNKSLALQNSITAFQNGVEWIDSTVLGMGRGAGNTPTESLLLELENLGIQKYLPKALFKIVLGQFEKLKKVYHWGPSILYYLSADYNIHPSYVQELISGNEEDPEKLINTIEQLRNTESSSYSLKKLNEASQLPAMDVQGDWNPFDYIKNKNILILGPGKSVAKYEREIEDLISTNNVFTISLNVNSVLNSKFISLYAISHPYRLLSEFSNIKSLNKPIVSPTGLWPKALLGKIKTDAIFNYGLKVLPLHFQHSNTECILPNRLVFGYALAIALASNPKKIYLAGLDGYEDQSQKNEEMDQTLSIIRKNLNGEVKIKSITPTKYDIETISLFHPNLFDE